MRRKSRNLGTGFLRPLTECGGQFKIRAGKTPFPAARQPPGRPCQALAEGQMNRGNTQNTAAGKKRKTTLGKLCSDYSECSTGGTGLPAWRAHYNRSPHAAWRRALLPRRPRRPPGFLHRVPRHALNVIDCGAQVLKNRSQTFERLVTGGTDDISHFTFDQ
jgi:hypothetical protein